MRKDAYISDDGLYRYNLVREWDENLPAMLFIMLNPSTADAVDDDPTIRRCIGFAERENCGMIEVVNLFAWRATNPKELKTAPDPIGPENDDIIAEAAADAAHIVCAWGTHGVLNKRNKDILWKLQFGEYSAMCLGTTKAGHPKHPLYIPKDQPLIKMETQS